MIFGKYETTVKVNVNGNAGAYLCFEVTAMEFHLSNDFYRNWYCRIVEYYWNCAQVLINLIICVNCQDGYKVSAG